MSIATRKIETSAIQFIAAELLLALEYLHSVGVSHRDIKPENIFVNETGHLKLGDLGSAGVSEIARQKLKIRNHKHKDGAKEEDKLDTFVGTKEYVSPEVLNGKGCSPTADMWSLGVIIFLLYTGYTPFYESDGEFYTFQNIMECKYKIPPSVPREAKDLIEKLLITSPKERLSASEAKEHEFFAEFDFSDPSKTESPLLKIYDLINKEKFDDESSCEYDSLADGDGFDVDFAESPAFNREILVNTNKEGSAKNAYKTYLKKSSSLGEKELLYLEEKQKELEENKPEEGCNIVKRSYANSAHTDDSKENSYDFNTWASVIEPSTPTLRDDGLIPVYNARGEATNKVGKKNIVIEGHIKKITAWIIYKRRYMELSYTDEVPRLVYYTANKNQLRNEIPLTKHTKVYSTGPSKFEISDLGHTFYFKDCGGEAKVKQWVSALSKAIANQNVRKMSFKGNKAFSASFA